MSTLFILFFISLAGIILMIGRKMVSLKNIQVQNQENFSFEIIHPDNIKHLANKNIKKYGYILLVTTIRSYIRSTNYLNKKYKQLKFGIKEKLSKRNHDLHELPKQREASGFLKMISEYKHKIKKIKHKILEEENMK